MKHYPKPRQRDGQTFVFFLVAFTTVFLLCGLGLDCGLYYLAKARLSRATDAAVISGVQNFAKGRDEVANIMRNIAVANYVDLADISTSSTMTTSTNALGGVSYHYAFLNDDGTFGLTNTIATGAEGHITLARTDANAPYRTTFMAITGIEAVTDLGLQASSEAERRPRLITVVLDRSGSMVTSGSKVLPEAVRVFLNSGFDTNADAIGIVSYSSYARLEMAHTNDFITIGTNLMYKADGDNKNGKQVTTHTNGMKFSGVTAADEGMRMALEVMRTNDGYRNEQYDKYIIFMTDGEFNSVRSLYASPTYTNRIMMTNSISTNNVSHHGMTLSPYLNRNKSSHTSNVDNYYYLFPNLTDNDEHDGNYQVATNNKAAVPDIFEPDIIKDTSSYRVDSGTDSGKVRGVVNVWLPPGSVAIHRDSVDGIPDSDTNHADNDEIIRNYFSYYTNSAVNIPLNPGEYIDLVLPGYVVDAVSSGYMTLNSNGKHNNFDSNNSYWPEYPEGEDAAVAGNNYFVAGDIWDRPNADSHYREWMMRNRSNLLWDFVLFKPEDGRWDGQEPYAHPPFGAGLYYPGGMFIWPHNNYVSQVSSNYYEGIPRISTNFTMSTPKFAGNTFYSSAGILDSADDWKVNVPSWLTNQFDSVMSAQNNPNPYKSAYHDYEVWRPTTYNGYLTPDTNLGRQQVYYMTNTFEYDASTNPITPPLASVDGDANTTGGWMYVYDTNGNRHLHMNSMSFNSRPTYFFDFKDNRWESITDWTSANLMTQTGDWKALRYCEIAREDDITIYTINFVNGNEGLLQKMANDSRSANYDPSAPEGKQYTAETGDALTGAFEEISKRIRAVITE